MRSHGSKGLFVTPSIITTPPMLKKKLEECLLKQKASIEYFFLSQIVDKQQRLLYNKNRTKKEVQKNGKI